MKNNSSVKIYVIIFSVISKMNKKDIYKVLILSEDQDDFLRLLVKYLFKLNY